MTEPQVETDLTMLCCYRLLNLRSSTNKHRQLIVYFSLQHNSVINWSTQVDNIKTKKILEPTECSTTRKQFSEQKQQRPSHKIRMHTQGVYRFNWTNFQEISRIFQEGFKKNPGHVCIVLARYVMYRMNYILMEHVMMSFNQRSSLCYSTDYNINNIFILHSLMHKQCHIIM